MAMIRSRWSWMRGMVVVVGAGAVLVAAGLAAPSFAAAGGAGAAGAAAAAPAALGSNRPGPSVGALPVAADGEVPALRTADSRTFVASKAPGPKAVRSGSGYVTQVSTGPVNYRDASGVWQKIDTTLVRSGSGFGPAGAPTRISVPADDSAGAVTVGAAGGGLSLRLLGVAASVGVTAGSSRAWPDALPGVTHRVGVSADGSGVEDALVLAGPAATSVFRYGVTVPVGDTAELADGAVVVRGAAGNRVGSVSAASMSDAAGAHSGAVSYGLAPGAVPGSYVLTVTANSRWLAAAGRVFPVTIDPFVFYDVSSSDPVVWARLDGQHPTTSEAGTYPAVGYDSGQTDRLLAKFDTSAIPTDAVIAYGDLEVDTSSTDNSNSQFTELHVMTQPWTAGATWDTYDGTHAWATPGGDFGADSPWYTNLPGDAEAAGYPITDVARGWIDGSAPNDGVLLKAYSEEYVEGDSNVNYFSDVDFYVLWEPHLGVPPAGGGFTHAIDDRSSLSVNLADGNLNVAATDLHVAGPGGGLTVGRAYNSRAQDGSTSVGGWALSPGPDQFIDDRGDAHGVQEADGSVAEFERSEDGTVVTAAPGVDADATLDPNNESPATVTDHASGTVTTFDQVGDPYGSACLSSIADKNGNTISLTYGTADGPGSCQQMTGITDQAGRHYTVSSDGTNYTGISDPAGRNVSYSITSGQLTGATDSGGQQTIYGYDSSGRLNKITSPAGRETLIGYDSQGRATSVTLVTDTGAGTGPTYTFAYTPPTTPGGSGSTVETDPNGHSTTITYDDQDQITSKVDALGHTRATTYSADAHPETLTDASNNVTQLSYDSLNNLTAVQAPGSGGGTGRSATLGYPTPSGSSPYPLSDYRPTSATDPQGNQTSYSYDTTGNVTTSTLPTSIDASLTDAYQGDGSTNCGGKPGELCSSTDARGLTTSYGYDSSGNLTSVTPPAPGGASTITVDADSRVKTVTDGRAIKTVYTYDGDDRIVQIRNDGSTSTTCSSTDAAASKCVSYTYDADGNVTGRLDAAGTWTFSYDALGRLTGETGPSTNQTLGYDAASNLTSFTEDSQEVDYGYDADNELTSLAEPGGACHSGETVPNSDTCTLFSYNANGQRTTTSYPTGETVTIGYDTSGRETSVVARRPSGTTFLSRAYVYTTGTGGGTDTDLRQSVTDQAGVKTSYTYDALNRLKTAVTGSTTLGYTYDADGNITASTKTGASTTHYGYNNANELCWSGPTAGSNGTTSCPTTPSGDSGYTYDGDGNRLTGGGITAVYNKFNQTTSATTGGTTTNMTYADVGSSLRTAVGANTNENTPLGVSRISGGGTSTAITRDPNGNLISLRTSTASSYYVLDALGSVLALTDSTGNTDTASYTYDPYGKTTSSTGSQTGINPFGYAGGYTDPSGQIHFGQRYYAPTVGSWTQLDSLSQINDPTQADRYAYAGDDPINDMDPTGQGLFGTIVGIVVGTAVGVATIPLDLTGIGAVAGVGISVLAGADAAALANYYTTGSLI